MEATVEELKSMERLIVFETMHHGGVSHGKETIRVYKQKPGRFRARLVALAV